MKLNELLQIYEIPTRVGPQFDISIPDDFEQAICEARAETGISKADLLESIKSNPPNYTMCLTLWEYSGVLFSSGNIPAVFKAVYVPLVKLAVAILNSELFEEMYDSSEDEYDDIRLDSAIRYKCYELDIEPEPAIPPQKPPLHDRLKPKQSIKKESFMEKTVRKNQTVAKIAGEIEIGKTGLTVLKNAIRQAKILPPMIAGYLDTAIGDVVCANILLMIGDQVKNEKFQFVAENALQASWLNVMSSFNIQDIVDKIMNNASIQNIMNQMPEMPKPSSK